MVVLPSFLLQIYEKHSSSSKAVLLNPCRWLHICNTAKSLCFQQNWWTLWSMCFKGSQNVPAWKKRQVCVDMLDQLCYMPGLTCCKENHLTTVLYSLWLSDSCLFGANKRRKLVFQADSVQVRTWCCITLFLKVFNCIEMETKHKK